MTISMPDSTNVADLPAGYPAYLGYADGEEATAGELAGRFPHANRVILTVTGNTIDCDGIDVEPGNPTAAAGALWTKRKLKADPHSHPVIYASVQGEPGYGMHEVISNLASLGVGTGQVRLLSAHYGAHGHGAHICGPRSCGLIGIEMDGTQWTDEYVWSDGNRLITVDMSLLEADFFTRTIITGTEKIVTELGIVRQGDTGPAVRTVQALCNARMIEHSNVGPRLDGVFGPETAKAVQVVQGYGHVTADGVVGPQTWPVLLGIA